MPKIVGRKKITKKSFDEILSGRRGNVIGRIAIPVSPKDRMEIKRLIKKKVIKI